MVQMIGSIGAVLLAARVAKLAVVAYPGQKPNANQVPGLGIREVIRRRGARRANADYPAYALMTAHVRKLDVCDVLTVGAWCGAPRGVQVRLTDSSVQDLSEDFILAWFWNWVV